MYVISCRRGFDSDQFLGAENRYRNYRNPTDHTAFDEMTLTDLLNRAKNKHVCLLIHGFRNEMSGVMSAYWEIVQRMSSTGVVATPGGYGLVIGFTWPGMATPAGYFAAQVTAKRAAPFLLEIVNHLRGVAHSVDVQTHSLGTRVALVAMKDPRKVFIDNLILSAPAVDNHLFEPNQDFFPAMESCNRCIVYHSKQDSVLGGFYPLADVSDGVHKALGRGGPRSKTITLAKTPNVYVVDCTARVKKDHSGYRKTDAYFKHWKTLLSGGPLSRYDELS
jgi:esterase/lipase superfamily enzyme